MSFENCRSRSLLLAGLVDVIDIRRSKCSSDIAGNAATAANTVAREMAHKLANDIDRAMIYARLAEREVAGAQEPLPAD
jgi:hypothetical protein